MQRLLDIMARLRDPETGCPWDVAQDFSTIAPYTIEEAYEVADAIEHGDPKELKDELGDLLFQVVFHAEMARERGWFDFGGVHDAVCEKMERRHPHVFGDADIASAEEQTEAWERHKAAERRAAGVHSLMDGVPRGMAELQRAVKLQKRAARVGFDWGAPAPVLEKIDEELAELREALAADDADHVEEELGDLLFAAVNLARQVGVDPARALRRANGKFEQRFRAMERESGGEGAMRAMDLDALEALWQRVKRAPGVAP